jgi:hypothetical protein
MVIEIVRLEHITAGYRDYQDGTEDSMSSKLSGWRTSQQGIEIIKIEQKTAGHRQS